jgi:hypothetical protein
VRTSSKIAIFAQLSIFDLLWTLPDGLTKHVPVHMIEQQQPHPRAETKKNSCNLQKIQYAFAPEKSK